MQHIYILQIEDFNHITRTYYGRKRMFILSIISLFIFHFQFLHFISFIPYYFFLFFSSFLIDIVCVWILISLSNSYYQVSNINILLVPLLMFITVPKLWSSAFPKRFCCSWSCCSNSSLLIAYFFQVNVHYILRMSSNIIWSAFEI